MVQINFARKEINCKIVYYGPGLSGKTTNLEMVHRKTPDEHKGELTCIATEGDRTLFFDFMPLHLGNIMGMDIKFQLYTVPGQVYYNSTRKLVLRGADGVIFVADSAPDKMAENVESMKNLRENLAEYGKDLKDIPSVIQFNKRDLKNPVPVETLNEKLNTYGVPTFEAVAKTGEGVFNTLKALSGLVIESINQKEESRFAPAAARENQAVVGQVESVPSGASVSSTATGASEARPSAPGNRTGSGPGNDPSPSTTFRSTQSSSVIPTAPPNRSASVPPSSSRMGAASRPPTESNRSRPASKSTSPSTSSHGTTRRSMAIPGSGKHSGRSAPAQKSRRGQSASARPRYGAPDDVTDSRPSKKSSMQTWLLVAFVLLFAVTAYFVLMR